MAGEIPEIREEVNQPFNIETFVLKETGAFLANLREKAALNVEEAAALLNYSSKERLAEYELGLAAISMDELHRILTTYGFPFDTVASLYCDLQRTVTQNRKLAPLP